MPSSLLALDFGASALHCMVADSKGHPLSTLDAPISYFTPEGQSELTREIHPGKTLDTAVSLIARAIAQANVTPSQIAAIGITGQRHSVVCLDDQGREILVSPMIDLRAAFEGAAIQDELGDDLYRIAGQFPAMLLAPAKLRWLENNRPDLRKNPAHVLTFAGWLAFKLTGTPASEPSLAAGVGLLDSRSATRSDEMLSRFNLSPSILPPLFPVGSVVGTVPDHLAQAWGLPHGIPVTLAGADTSCGLLGMGLTRPGDTALVAGWSAAVQTVTASPQPDPQAKVWFSPSPISNHWLAEVNLGDTGHAHRWLKDLLLGPDVTFSDADALAASAPPGSNGCLSYLGPGPLTAPEASLRTGGLLFPVPLLYRMPAPAEALRGFWESLAYAIKANLVELERASGHAVHVLHLGGGMARSPLFAQILAGVTGKKIRRSSNAHVSLLGAVAAASVAAGLHSTLTQASHSVSPQWIDAEPDPSDVLEYDEFYQRWKILYHRIQNV